MPFHIDGEWGKRGMVDWVNKIPPVPSLTKGGERGLHETKNSKPTLTHALSQGEREGDLRKAAKEFEAFFLQYLLKTMRESVPKDGLLSGGRGEEIYTSMLDEALSEEMAAKGGIGIGELMMRQLESKK